MTDHDLTTLWNSPENRPDPGDTAAAAETLLRSLNSRRRGFVIMMGLAGSWLAVLLARLAWLAVEGRELSLRQEWGAILLLTLPLGTLIFLIAQFRRHCQGHAGAGQSIQAGLRALLDENRLARHRLKIIAALHVAVMLIIPIVVVQLRAVGKAGNEITVPAFVLLPLLQIVILLAMLRHHQRHLQPQRRELEALLADYGR